jgi:hypothetical protein
VAELTVEEHLPDGLLLYESFWRLSPHLYILAGVGSSSGMAAQLAKPDCPMPQPGGWQIVTLS